MKPSTRMPAEWEIHEATWLTWPTNRITWPGKMLKETESIYVQMIAALLPGESVHLVVPDKKTADKVLKLLQAKKVKSSGLFFHVVKAVDTWIRDYGPVFVKDAAGEVSFTKWTFNAWGGKYPDLALDNGVVPKLDYLKQFKSKTIPMVLEGGSIDMNGRGTCLTTEQCLLNPNRNPKLTRSAIEERLKSSFGLKKIIWLKEGIEGDDTDGHIDDISRFVGPHTILTAVEPDPKDPNHKILNENFKILKESRDAQGRLFKIVELPMPGRVEVTHGHSSSGRLPASYANFYIGNATVLVPTYSHKNDKRALKIIQALFPKKKTVGIECTTLVYGLGSIHCVTQQQPA